MPPEVVTRIAETFIAWKEIDGFSTIVSRDEVALRDYNISPSRYVHSTVEGARRPLDEIVDELDELAAEAAVIDRDLGELLKQLQA